jgi:hypothetical protein
MSYFAADALTEGTGYAACALVLITFCFNNPVWLRTFALSSNAAFIAFGYLGEIHSIMLLHMVLVPINSFHLAKLCPIACKIVSMLPRPKECRSAGWRT